MKTIIKWSGGKSQEIKLFSHKIPNKYNRYIEPFIGGGGVYFNLEYKCSIINDINFELISFYNIIKNNKLREKLLIELNLLNKQRDIINKYFDLFTDNQIKQIFNENIIEFHSKKILCDELKIFLEFSLNDKIKRIKKIQIDNNKEFTIKELKEHLITGYQSGLYFYCRNIYNKGFKKENNNISFYIANWYYVREFCYSSMFRFSKNGNFNVPYGGISYNNKDFKIKIDNLNNINLLKLIKKTNINMLDFEDLFIKYDYFNEDDFIFLDPPYDSEFSQYNKEKDFDKIEQIRLRDILLKTKAKIMIVIKETDFIYDLYKDNFIIERFDKKYLTNMRNRNDKDVQHLIITNY